MPDLPTPCFYMLKGEEEEACCNRRSSSQYFQEYAHKTATQEQEIIFSHCLSNSFTLDCITGTVNTPKYNFFYIFSLLLRTSQAASITSRPEFSFLVFQLSIPGRQSRFFCQRLPSPYFSFLMWLLLFLLNSSCNWYFPTLRPRVSCVTASFFASINFSLEAKCAHCQQFFQPVVISSPHSLNEG